MKTTITLDDHTAVILESLAAHTGLSIADIAMRPLAAYLAEFCELVHFLDAQHAGAALHAAGVNLLVSFGPEPITAGIKAISPDYETLGEQFERELHESIGPALLQ